MTRTRGLSLRGDWHDFEVLETHGAGIDGDAAMSVRLTCDGINGDAFPLNAADGSARRPRAALSPWPSLLKTPPPPPSPRRRPRRRRKVLAPARGTMGSDAPAAGGAAAAERAAVAAAACAAVAAAAAGRLRQPAAVQPVGPEQGGERRQPRRLPERQDEQVGLGNYPNYYGCHGSGSSCNCLYHCRHHGACCAYKPPEPPAVVEAPPILDAPPKELRAPTCASVCASSPKVPRAASLAARRWTARVHRGVGTDAPRCAEITDKAECCAAVDTTGDVCVPAVTTFSDGSVCAGWVTTLLSSASDRTAVAMPAARRRRHRRRGRACAFPLAGLPRVATAQPAARRVTGARRRTRGAPCVPATTSFESGAVCEAAGDVAATYRNTCVPAAAARHPAELGIRPVADTADGVNGCDTSNAKVLWMARVNLDKASRPAATATARAAVPSCTCRWLVHDAIAVRPHAPAG